MRAGVRAATVRSDEVLIVGLAGLVLVAGLTVGGGTPLSYLVVALPIVVGVSWWRPVYGLAMLLGLVLFTEEYEISTMAGGLEPWVLQTLPIFRNLQDFTPLSGVYANAVELWVLMLVGVWFTKGVLARRLRLAPVPCPAAWLAGLATIGVAFVLGILSGGDVKPALWEVRALGYLFGLVWLVPQLVEERRDVGLLLGVMAAVLGLKALQGLYRYVVELHMQVGLRETFMAHEEPVMFVPLFFLLFGLHHYRAAPGLRRLLYAAAPAMLLALVFTQRRVAYVGLAVCLLAFGVELSGQARRTLVRLVMPVLLAGAAYVAVFAGSASPLAQPIERFLTLFDSDNMSNVYRLLELQNLRYTIQAHPWGLGFGHPYEIVRLLPKLDYPLQDYIAHNQVMWLWAKAGTLGFVLVMFFFARFVAEGAWIYRHVPDPLLRVAAAVVPVAILNQLIASSFEQQLTYARNMVYLGTLLGLLGPIRALSRLDAAGPRPRWRWRLLPGQD